MTDIEVKITRTNGYYKASCSNLDVYCFGSTSDQAKSRLKYVLLFYATTASELGYNIDFEELISFGRDLPKVSSISSSIH